MRAIRDHGGFVFYDYELDDAGKKIKNASPWEPNWLLSAIGIDFLHSVEKVNLVYGQDSVTGSRIEVDRSDDAIVSQVKNLPRLKWLLLAEGQATDDTMKYVAMLPRLQKLYMWDAESLTDEGVARLRGLSNLEYVHISESNITDESIRHLSKCPKIEGLSMQGNRFTNKCLQYASRLSRLKSLVIGLGDISVSDDGLFHLNSL